MNKKFCFNKKILFFILFAILLLLFILIMSKLVLIKTSYRSSASEISNTNDKSGSYIIGGTSVLDPKKWPFTVILFDIFDKQNFEPLTYSFCSGSLISPKWVLTAAHCVFERKNNVSELGVVIGLNNIATWQNKDIYILKKIIIHENFNSTTLENDIALLELESPVKSFNTIKTISLNDDLSLENIKSKTQKYQYGVILGYGLTEENGPKVNSLYQGVIPIRSKEVADKYKIKNTQIAAGYVYGGVCPTHGDSGGPFISWNGTRWLQIGITSWGFGSACINGTSLQLYTRISSYLDWIKEKTSQVICNVSCHKVFIGPNQGLFFGIPLTEKELKEFNCRWNGVGETLYETFTKCLQPTP